MTETKSKAKVLDPGEMRLCPAVVDLLCCPVCRGELELCDDNFQCKQSLCSSSFPIINGTPVLLNERGTVFAVPQGGSQAPARPSFSTRAKNFLNGLLPDATSNVRATENYQKLGEVLRLGSRVGRAKVLIVGGRVQGEGMESLFLTASEFELVQTDVVFGPETDLLCDAHDLPFGDSSFDCVIIQAVLEHVLDPYRCVAEIHRVLKDDGVVYAETPFMQQVHMGCHDFTRFTHLGHRRLFRRFEEIDSGAACGPGTALAWSYRYFLSSFSENKWLNWLLNAFGRLTAFHLKYFDRLLINKPGSYDAASAYYFLGRKSPVILSDRELLKLYKGAQ